MPKPTKKQFAVTADQIALGMNYFEELNIPFVLVFEGIPKSFSNASPLHSAALIEQQYLLNAKIQEYQIENEADKQTAIPKSRDD